MTLFLVWIRRSGMIKTISASLTRYNLQWTTNKKREAELKWHKTGFVTVVSNKIWKNQFPIRWLVHTDSPASGWVYGQLKWGFGSVCKQSCTLHCKWVLQFHSSVLYPLIFLYELIMMYQMNVNIILHELKLITPTLHK